MNREKDRELYKLAQYLKEIAKLEDFSGLNHKHWERCTKILNLLRQHKTNKITVHLD